jgi:Fe-Mn family superoxide dismutase
VLTVDVWEHAYYIDYRNERAKYVEALWKAANWDFAGKCYAAVVK